MDMNQQLREDRPDLTEEEASREHWSNAIGKGLSSTNLVEIVDATHEAGQLHYLCRVKKENEREWVHGPLLALLKRTQGKCHTFMGKEFFLKDGKLVYGWVVSFGSEHLDKVVVMVSEALEKFLPAVEVVEAPMLGSGTPVGNLARGVGTQGRKGASVVR